MGTHHSRWDHIGGSGGVLHVSRSLLFGGAVLYGCNQVFLKDWLNSVFVQAYVNDILAGVTLIAYVNLLCLTARRPEFCLLSPVAIASFMLGVGVFWEFVTPLYRIDAVSDPLDLLAYVGGGVAYWLVLVGVSSMSSQRMQTRPGGPS